MIVGVEVETGFTHEVVTDLEEVAWKVLAKYDVVGKVVAEEVDDEVILKR